MASITIAKKIENETKIAMGHVMPMPSQETEQEKKTGTHVKI